MTQYYCRYLILLLFALCTACLEVDDPSEQWEAGIVDPILTGKWQVDLIADGRKVEDFRFEFIQNDDHLAIKDLKETEKRLLQARSFTHNNFSFLLIYDDLKKQTLLYPYQDVTQGTAKKINLYIPNKQSFAQLIKQFPELIYFKNGGLIGMHHVKKLDDAFLDQLIAMIANPNAWAIAKMTPLQE